MVITSLFIFLSLKHPLKLMYEEIIYPILTIKSSKKNLILCEKTIEQSMK